ncbi:MAG: hypothetical protein JWN34_5535, partial [Bryobacterales bacterium]|nr:hypothetical protein [Bryobacterales bacterium]
MTATVPKKRTGHRLSIAANPLRSDVRRGGLNSHELLPLASQAKRGCIAGSLQRLSADFIRALYPPISRILPALVRVLVTARSCQRNDARIPLVPPSFSFSVG